MTEIVQYCLLCGSDQHILFDQRQFRGQAVTNVICQHCGLVYQSPRMTAAESQAFYEAEYRLLYQGQQGPNLKDLAVQTERARLALDFVRPQVKAAARLLDIGCSAGILLHQFKEYYQSHAVGVEPGNVYRQYAQSTGLEVVSSLDELPPAAQPGFGLISMMHVLEHLPDPVEYLIRLRTAYLQPHGWLLLEVPNLYAHDSFELAHLVSYSAHTLQQVLNQAGYSLIKLRKHGHPRSDIIPLYLTALAQPAGSTSYTLKPDHLVHAQRRLGLLRRKLVERLFPQRAWLPTE